MNIYGGGALRGPTTPLYGRGGHTTVSWEWVIERKEIKWETGFRIGEDHPNNVYGER